MTTSDDYNTEEDVMNLFTKIINMKTALVDRVIRQHLKFENVQMEIKELSSKFESVHMETERVICESSKVSDVLSLSIEDREKHEVQINSLKTMKQIVSDLIVLNRYICNLHLYSEKSVILRTEDFDKISEELRIVNIKLKAASTIRAHELKAYNSLLTSLANVKSELTSKVERLWEENIIINNNAINPFFNYEKTVSYGDFVPHCVSAEINLSPSILKSLICLMCHLDIGCLNVCRLLRFISSEIIYPTIENFPVYRFMIKSTPTGLSIISAAKHSKEEMPNTELINTFIQEITDTFKGLHAYLLSIVIPDRDSTILELFQKKYFDIFLTESLITYFLNEVTIDSFMVTPILEFEAFLKEYHFVCSSNLIISDFVNNSDRRARDNDVTNMLSMFRNVYLQSMLDCETVSDDLISSIHEEEPFLSDPSDEMYYMKLLDIDQYLFPSCKVSGIVVQTINTIVESIQIFNSPTTTNESTKKVAMASTDLLRMLPDMVMMYLYVVPITNRDLLDQLPLASVLHYNNCMYLAHHCLYLTTEIKSYADKIKSGTSELLSSTDEVLCTNAPSSLLSLVYRFRSAAIECITHEVNKQKLIISEFFESFTSFRDIGTAEQGEKINKLIKKCCYHLSSLSKIYDGLSNRIFNNVFGSIIDCALKQVVQNVLNMTDIVQTDNEPLITVLNVFKNQLVEIMEIRQESRTDEDCDESVDVLDVINTFFSENCSKWATFQELLFVLENSLKAIEDRWLSPDSKMAQHIKAEELCSLIKALFKNSLMRSKVIEKII